MDQGLKERLIGAAVLVALGVWLIPWVLDGPDAQSEIRSAALQLPAPEEPVPIRTQTLQLNPPAAAAGSDAVPDRSTAPETPDADPAPLPAPERAAAVPAVVTPPAEPAVQTQASPKGSPAVAVTAPAPATRAAAVAKPPAGTWLVQLGSFSEEENARRLAQRVATFGYEADISTYRASGRSMYRVRVGPHETRARADAAASALTAHGFVAQVVAAD